MDISIKLHTIKSGGSIAYIEESQFFPKNVVLYSLKMIFVLANRADPDEMVKRVTGQFGKYISLHHNDTMRL